MSNHNDRLDSGGLTYLLQRIKTIFTSMFQAKEEGKGLSTNDYTDAEKTKLAGIEEGATANIGTVTGITMNSTAQTVDENGVVDLGTVITEHQDISGKADKDTDAVVGNFASFDASGNPVDSGHKHSDYITDVSDKADKVASATSGHFAGLDSNGNLTDSGVSSSDFIASSLKGSVNGVAELNANGIVPSSQLPSYVDDVVDGYFYDDKFYEDEEHTIEITGESGKIYVDLSTNKTYRWSGTVFVVIASDLALGETDSTAYRGDRGAAAYAAAVTNVDSTPTSGSGNLVTSGGVYTAMDDKADKTDTVLNTTLSMGRNPSYSIGTNSTGLGNNVVASGNYSFATGYSVKATSNYAYAEGYQTTASAQYTHAEGSWTTASGTSSHSEGASTRAVGSYSHAEGYGASNKGALGKADHAEGYQTTANSGTNGSYYGAHAEGYQTTASSQAAHAEGHSTTASGNISHAEGYNTIASGSYAHAEGYGAKATSTEAHAEGFYTTANGTCAHAEGNYTKAPGGYSHAEGNYTEANANGAHAEGYYSKANGQYSHAAGSYTDAQGYAQFVFGNRNVPSGAEVITVPTLENAEPYDPTKKEYPRGSVVKVGDTIYVAHNLANVKRAAPNYDTVNWHQYTGTVSGDPAYWSTDVLYNPNDIVKVNVNGTDIYYMYHSSNMQYAYIVPGVGSDGSINWHSQVAGSNFTNMYGKYAEIVGNGALYTAGANIRSLDWDGNQYLKGNVYVECNDDSTGGTPLVKSANPEFTGSLSLNRKANTTIGGYSVAIGNINEASGWCSYAEGQENVASDVFAHAEGYRTTASGTQSHAEGAYTTASAVQSHAEGGNTTASGAQSHAEGYNTRAIGPSSHAEGNNTLASGDQSHAEGAYTTASGVQSHAEGSTTTASAGYAHAEGGGSTASATYSHAEGGGTTASGNCSHAEGSTTSAYGDSAHAEGSYAYAIGEKSHAEGYQTSASGSISHAEGSYTTARGYVEHVSGRFNVLDTAPTWVSGTSYSVGDLISKEITYIDGAGTTRGCIRIYKCKTANSDTDFTASKWDEYGQYLFVVGNGTSSNARSNAVAIDWEGNQYLKGDLYVGCNADSTGGTKVATVTDVSAKIDSTEKGTVNGVAELDANGKVPTAQLPSYVDDVLEYASTSAFPATGETGKIYVALDTNKTYRWSGSEYVEISASLALGETSSTAYRGDRGATAYSHATDASRLTTAQTSGLYKIATTAEGHVASVTAVQKADITALGIPAQDTTYESKAAVSGGTDVSLVTTGEKYGWNSKSTVYEYASVSSFPATGVSGQLYIALDTNVIYRWDTTTSDYVAISGGGGGGSAGLEKKAISIATTDWTSATGGYTATVTDSRITAGSETLMIYDSSVSSLTSNIEMTKNTGSVTFSVATMPTGTISGVLYIITELHVDNGLPAVTAADNGKILQVVNGEWALVTIPSATGVIY